MDKLFKGSQLVEKSINLHGLSKKQWKIYLH